MNIVIYGEKGHKYPTCISTRENMEKHKEQFLMDMEDPVLFEEFEADNWGHAMTYYRAKYFGELYKPGDPNVWEPFEAEVDLSVSMKDQVLTFLKQKGPCSPRDVEKHFKKFEKEARIATQELLSSGAVYLNEKLRLTAS